MNHVATIRDTSTTGCLTIDDIEVGSFFTSSSRLASHLEDHDEVRVYMKIKPVTGENRSGNPLNAIRVAGDDVGKCIHYFNNDRDIVLLNVDEINLSV